MRLISSQVVRWEVLVLVEALEEEEAGGEEGKVGKVGTRGRGVAAKVVEVPAREGEVEDMEEAEVAGVEVEEVEAWAYHCLPYLGLVIDELLRILARHSVSKAQKR